MAEARKEGREEEYEVRLVWMERDGGLMVRLPRPVPVKRLGERGGVRQGPPR